MPNALIYPHTAPSKSLVHNLLPWFAKAQILIPPGTSVQGFAAELSRAGLVEEIRPDAPEAASSAPEQQELKRLLRQWEDWVAVRRSKGDLEAIKAGVTSSPPPQETVRSLIEQIRTEPKLQSRDEAPPEFTPELLLHLAHVRDLAARDVEDSYDVLQEGQEKLNRSLGLDLEDAAPAEYSQVQPDGAPPVDYRMLEEELLEPRLKAWARLLPPASLQGAVPAALGQDAARILGERLKAGGRRSPAGVQSYEPVFIAWPPRAARMVLPDLGALKPADLAGLLETLAAEGALEACRQGLNRIIRRAADEPMSASLAGELNDSAQELAAGLEAHLPRVNRKIALEILTLPGVDPKGLLALMCDEPFTAAEGSLVIANLVLV